MLSTCRRPQTCPHARWKRLPPSSFSHLSSGTGRQARRGDAVLLARQSLEDGKLVVELVQVLTHSTGTEMVLDERQRPTGRTFFVLLECGFFASRPRAVWRTTYLAVGRLVVLAGARRGE